MKDECYDCSGPVKINEDDFRCLECQGLFVNEGEKNGRV